MQSHTELMFPVLQFFNDGEVHTKSETCDYGKSHFGFSPQELEERLNSGSLAYRSRIEWAITYLSYTKALNDTTRLLQRTKRATYQITELGKKLAQDKNAYLVWWNNVYGKGTAQVEEKISKNELSFRILQFVAKHQFATRKDIYAQASNLGFSPDEQKIIYDKSGNYKYQSVIGHAICKICYDFDLPPERRLLEKVGTGRYEITELGKQIVQDRALFNRWLENSQELDSQEESAVDELQKLTPQEQIEQGAAELHANLKAELLAKIQAQSPQFFERLVLKLLVKMGYGVNGHHRLTPNTADGGIDGIIYEDELGLNKIYLQAKCWQNPISRPELQKFAGAISDKNTPKGVFITTSYFSKEAERYAHEHQRFTIALIDGDRLAELMIKYKLGVETDYIVEICRPDNDFFDEE